MKCLPEHLELNTRSSGPHNEVTGDILYELGH